MSYDWPVINAIVDLPIKMKGNSKCTSSNLLNLLRAQNKDLSTPVQTLLTEVRICLQCRLCFICHYKISVPEVFQVHTVF